MTGREAVQTVDSARTAFFDHKGVLNSTHGPAYEQAKRDDERLWRELQATRRALRDHIYEAYGIDISTLERLSAG